MSDGGSFRPMKFPYTFTAKIAQFPYRYYYKHSWFYKYWLFGVVACIPIFYQIQKLSFSPNNVKKWEKIWEETFVLPPKGHQN